MTKDELLAAYATGQRDFRGADLSRADLSGADLSGATLRDADLYGANLCGANLRGADLSRANLRGADLSGATLRDADLYGANLYGANLSGVAESIGLTLDAALPQKILDAIASAPETWDQGCWHSACRTKHCMAGFATHLSGPLGAYLEAQMGTMAAATLLLWRPDSKLPSFEANATEDETLGRLRAMALHAAGDGP